MIPRVMSTPIIPETTPPLEFSSLTSSDSSLVNYARISTADQKLELQNDALKEAGCIKIFSDTVSGANKKRKGLDDALEYLREGDTLIVWKLDRLGRSLKHLIEVVNLLKERNISFKSLKDGIDASSPMGAFFFHVTASLAELERNIIRERTQAGLDAARARGKKGGRKYAISEEKFITAKKMYEAKIISVKQICMQLNIKESTFYRELKRRK